MQNILRKQKNYAEQGFTLVEILVVILIIGILASIAIPVFLNQRQKASESSLKADLKNIGIAMETSLVENKGKYPSSLPAGFRGSEGNIFRVSPESGNTNVAAGSASGVDTVYPGSIGFHGKVGSRKKVDDYNSNSYAGLTESIYGGPYWDYIPADANGIPTGKAFSGSIQARSSEDVCFHVQFEQHKGESGWGTIKGSETCLKAGEWKEVTVSGVTTYPTIKLTLVAYSSHTPGSTFDYKEPIITIGDKINKGNITLGADQRYCVQGFHENNKSNIWHYSTLNGGVEQGPC